MSIKDANEDTQTNIINPVSIFSSFNRPPKILRKGTSDLCTHNDT